MATATAPRWSKAVLIPFWTIQLLFTSALFGLQIWGAMSGLQAAGLLVLIICPICIILDVTEIILFARGTLQSITYLVLQCVKTALWVVIFLLTVVGTVREENVGLGSEDVNVILLGGVIEAVVVLLAFIATLIYASVIHHRHRRSKHRRSISTLDHDRYYNGPYASLGIVEATSLQPQLQIQEADGSGSGSLPRYEAQSTYVADGLSDGTGWRREMTGGGEVHELATCRSVRSVKAR